MQIREEEEYTISEFSKQLKYTFNWFDSNFTKIVSDTFCEFWDTEADVKLVSVSENTNLLAEGEEFFVTQIRLNKELSVFIRLSKSIVKAVLENILGANGKNFNIEKITELEAKILTGFDDFLYKNFSHLIKPADSLPVNNNNYNESILTFFLKSNNNSSNLGKIVVKIPIAAIEPEMTALGEETFNITNFLKSTAEVKLNVGYTRMRLNELKHLENGDIVVLEHSKSSKMFLTYKDYSTEIRVAANPAIMVDYDNFEDNGDNPKGDIKMPNPDIYNMWDTIQVDIGAEFEKVKLTLGELKQISEGLVVDIGSVYDNKIDLKVEDKIVASGELIIINDRYGVKINQIFTEEKNIASENAQYAEPSEIENEAYTDEFEEELPQTQEYSEDEFSQPIQTEEEQDVNEEDFDYSDFDVDDEDI